MKHIQQFFVLVKNVKRSFGLSLRYARWTTILMSLAMIINYILPLLQSKVLGNIIDKLINTLNTNSSINGVVYLVFIYSAVWVGTRLAAEVRLYIDKKWSLEVEQNLEMDVLKKRSEIDIATHENPKFQDLQHKAFNRGVWPIYQLVDMQFRNFANIALIVASSIIASSINWKLYVVAILCAIPTFIVRLKYGAEQWSIWSENSPRKRVYEHIRSHMRSRTGIMQNKLLQATSKLLGIANKILDDFKNEQQKVDYSRLIYATIANIISAGGFGFGLYILVKGVTEGDITPGTLVFIVGVLASLINSVNALLETIAEQYEKNLYANDIFAFLDTKPSVIISKNPISLNLTASPKIVFENVCFKYDGRNDLILDNVSFTIEPGEHIAFVGENGAGKSTLIKLLMRIYDPTSGRITVNGVDLKDADYDEWISYVAVLMQKYMLHEMKVSESISMGRADSISNELQNESSVKKSATQSGAHDFIIEYSKGYEQQLGKEFEDGIEPSQGQEQKIALARTLYRLEKGFMIILDEPTSAIDPLAEAEIFRQMEDATAEKNLVLITHRFNTVKDVDKIIVLEHGKIVEIGSHKELMSKNGHYAQMFNSQAEGFIEGSK